MKTRHLAVRAAVAAAATFVIAGCGGADDVAQLQDSVDRARDTVQKARQLDAATVERAVREAASGTRPVKDVSCPIRPDLDLTGTVTITCKLVDQRNRRYNVPVMWTPGLGVDVQPPVRAR